MNWILPFILGLLIGGIGAFFLTRRLITKQIKDNPPINEKMIRAMYAQMGRKPKESDIRQIMKTMNPK